MDNVSALDTATVVLPAANRSGGILLLQNQSDTNLRIAFGSNIGALTTTVGFLLEPGEAMSLDGPLVSRAVSAISTGASGKQLHWSLN